MERERKYTGIGVSPGVAMAHAYVHRPAAIDPPHRILPDGDAAPEWERLVAAKGVARHQIQQMLDALGLEASGGEGGILEAHLMTLDDEMLIGALRREIFEKHHNAEWAVSDIASDFANRLRSSKNPLLAERAGDITDMARRLLRALMGTQDTISFTFEDRRIVVAENLTPSEALSLPRDRVAGVALDRGGITSHAALLVRALGIPAVFGLGDFSSNVESDAIVAIDGNAGEALISPGENEEAHLNRLAAEREALIRTVRERACEKVATPDGVEVRCMANIEDADGINELLMEGADGVGLFRTEYLWLSEGRPVEEDRQVETYATAAKALVDRRLAIRAFDLGGDKFRGGAGMGKSEDNPFLGTRSIRFLLANKTFFKIQIRAILRASAVAGRAIDFTIPMVSDIGELVQTRHLIEDCADELAKRGTPYVLPRVGIMVEVPSTALCARAFASHCDYFSLGTNDLTQSTLAVDRCNASAAHLYQPLHPSVLSLVRMTVDAANKASIGVSACGEMAGDPLSALVLLGLGVREFSMAPSAIPLVKETFRRVPAAKAAKVATLLGSASTAKQIRHCARNILAHFAPEILRQC